MLLNEEFVQIHPTLNCCVTLFYCCVNFHSINYMIVSSIHIMKSLSAKSFFIITLKGSPLPLITGELLKQSAVILLADNEAMISIQLWVLMAWWSIGGSKGGARDEPPTPGGPNSFIFMQFLGQKLKNNSTFGSWRTPLGKILDPPLWSMEQVDHA